MIELIYGDGKFVGKENYKSQMIVLQNISVLDEANYQAWKNKLLIRQSLKHPNIIELQELIQSAEEQVCSTFYKVNLVFESYFGEQEILYILNGLIEGLAKLKKLRFPNKI